MTTRRTLGYRSTFAFFYAEQIREMAPMTLAQKLDSARSQLQDLRERAQRAMKAKGKSGEAYR